VPRSVSDGRVEQRILEQSMRLPDRPEAAVTAWAACRLFGAAFFDGLDRDGRTRLPVPLALSAKHQIRAAPGCVLLRARLTRREVTVVADIRCTTPTRAVFDAMRTAGSVRDAVVALDMAAIAQVVTLPEMRLYVGLHPAWTGVPVARAALPLASSRSRSPAETRTRLIWLLDAGLPPPLVNQPIWDPDGNLLGIVDLLDAASGTVVEFDGADHLDRGRRARDVGREQLLRDAGLEVLVVTGPDLPNPTVVAQRMHAARTRARWRGPDTDGWTLTPPGWWRQERSMRPVA
jgi:hypothetical protein